MVDVEFNKREVDTVRVALQIRPLIRQEVERGGEKCIEEIHGDPQIQIKDLEFTYNYVFPQHITPQEFYATAIKGLIGKWFQGYHVTILVSSQTDSGKTFTKGTNYSGSNGDSTNQDSAGGNSLSLNDDKAANIARLNNSVNDLRQLIGELPTASEESNEQLLEKFEKEKARYVELLKKHKHITEHLNNMLIENTNLREKALLAEAAKDKIERKLNELADHCNQTIENLTTTDKLQDDDGYQTSVVDYLKEIKTRLEDLQSVNLKVKEELIDHEINLSVIREDDSDKVNEDVVMNEDQAVLEEGKRAMGQVALSQELQELNRAMAIKASVVQTILANNKDMAKSQKKLREFEEKIGQLEKEKEELLQQLKQTKSKYPFEEERRKKVSSLEAEILGLKKKCQQQGSIIKMKEKNEQKIASLNAELRAMKATEEKIIRQMREETEKFRKWKADKDRALLRLRNEERKRATAMAKMESLYAKQQTVLKRKMEEVIAVNKRLKEALDRQKQTSMKRNLKGNVNAGAVKQYIEQELEVHLSIVEAEKSLEELMKYRAWRTEQIETLRNSADSAGNQEKIVELEDEVALRNAQISDLQQKILTADHENKSRTQWNNIQSVLEAKVALKCLFEFLVHAKRELQNQSEKVYQARFEEIKEAYDRLMIEFESNNTKCEQRLAAVKQQNEQNLKQLSALVALQRGVIGRGDRSEVCNQLLHTDSQCQQARLEQVEQENPSSLTYLYTTPPTCFVKRNRFDATYVKKKKNHFVPQDANNDEIENYAVKTEQTLNESGI